jgi:predicted adenylyl cyclase CyaB
MARNVEIKARVTDAIRLEQSLTRLEVDYEEELRQVDTFFRVPYGRLKLREFGDGTAELIHYHRADRSDAKLSDYERAAVTDAQRIRSLLTRALGIRGTVTKDRTVMLVGKTRVHLDKVEGLGSFLELEVILDETDTVAVGEATARAILKLLELPASDLVSGAYIDLLESAGIQTGEQA